MIPINNHINDEILYPERSGGDDGSVYLNDYLGIEDHEPLFHKMDWTLISGWGRHLNLIEKFAELE